MNGSEDLALLPDGLVFVSSVSVAMNQSPGKARLPNSHLPGQKWCSNPLHSRPIARNKPLAGILFTPQRLQIP